MLSRLASNFPRHVVPASRRAISVQSILHGSREAKEAGEIETQHHSRIIARGKYLHGIEKSRVRLHAVQSLTVGLFTAYSERYYTGLRDDPELRIKLSGNFEAIVGEQDTFYHVLEYENHSGLDNAWKKIPGAHNALRPFLRSRATQLAQEFAFLPTSPPHEEGGIFELRAYQLSPATWRRGIEARRKLVRPVGAWYAQIGRLHQVYHLWQYQNLETRKEMRERAWEADGWADTVHKTSQLARSMDSFILTPLPFSPLK
ncbi:NIPSNAP-domain-containing protein [Lactarius deliciosus]|nr:NIPSNAP-domain-containing protein [Lactarius deliciosus]